MLCGNKTPSPSRDQVLRAHSPWTALRQRKKGRQDACAAAPLRESDDDDGNSENRAPAGEDTHMHDLEDKMLNLGFGKVARPLVPRENQGSGRFGSPPPPARAFRQRLVPLRTNNGGRRHDHGPFSVPSAAPAAQHFDAASQQVESAFQRAASETGPALSLPFGTTGWMSSVGHLPASNPCQLSSFGSDGVLQGGPGAAPHLGPALPRSVAYLQQQQQQQQHNLHQDSKVGAFLQHHHHHHHHHHHQQQQQQALHPDSRVGEMPWHPQVQHGAPGLASSAEGLLGGAAGAGLGNPIVPTTGFLHSLSDEGPLMDNASAELQQGKEGMGPLTAASHSNQSSLLGAVPYTNLCAGVRPVCCSRLSSSTGVPSRDELCKAQVITGGAEGVSQQQPCPSPLATQARAVLPLSMSNEPRVSSSDEPLTVMEVMAGEPSDADASCTDAALQPTLDDQAAPQPAPPAGTHTTVRTVEDVHAATLTAALHPSNNQAAPDPVPAGSHTNAHTMEEVHAVAMTAAMHPLHHQAAAEAVPVGMHANVANAAAMTATLHRRTSSAGSGGTFRICSSFQFPRNDTHRGDDLEDGDAEEEEEEEEDGAPSCSGGRAEDGLGGSGSGYWPTASAGGVASLVKGKRSPQQHQLACLLSPGYHPSSRDTFAAGAASPADHHPGGTFCGRADHSSGILGGGAHAGASTPAGQSPAGGGCAEAMQQSTGCGEKTGGGSVRCFGKAGYYSDGSSADKKAPGPQQRTPTPAGLLLGCCPMCQDDDDNSEDMDLEGRSSKLESAHRASTAMASGGSFGQNSCDVSAFRDQGPSSSMRALKRSGSLAARSRYVQSGVAWGEGLGIGLGVVAAPDEGLTHGCKSVHDCKQQQGGCEGGYPDTEGAGKAAYGSWGAVESGQRQMMSGTSAGDGLAPPFHQAVQGCGSSSSSGGSGSASPESHGAGDDELAHLMCDECDFVTPPHSPKATSQGGKIGQGAGPLRNSMLREGAFAAGEAALQLCKARCASTSAAERHDAQQQGFGVLHPHMDGSEIAGQVPVHSLQHGHSEVHSSTVPLSTAATPAWAGAHHHHTTNMMLCNSSVAELMYPNSSTTTNHAPHHPLLTTPDWGVSRPATQDSCSGDVELGEAATCEGQLLHHCGSGGSGWGGDSDEEEGCAHKALDSLVSLEDFNGHMSRAAAHGNGGQAIQLWAELRTRNIAPDLRTLNMLMRCLSKTTTDPDHAEHIMSEVCALGDLTPNATTHILLAEIRVRFEQLLGL